MSNESPPVTGRARPPSPLFREYDYDETDLTAIRVDSWKMHIGVKYDGSWWNAKSYPNIPYVFNLLMDPMEKMDPESHE